MRGSGPPWPDWAGCLSTIVLWQGETVDVGRPGRKLVSRGILVIQNITKHDAGIIYLMALASILLCHPHCRTVL